MIRQSIQTVKNNYWLLIYGIVLGGVGRNISSNTSWDEEVSNDIGEEIGSIINSTNPQAALEETGKVLGVATNSFLNWLSSVPDYKWIFLILAIVVSIVVAIVIGLIMTAWAYGGLVKGIEMAHRGEKVTLLTTSVFGLENLSELVKLVIYRGVFYLASFMVVAFPLLIIFLLDSKAYIVMGIYAFIGFIILLMLSIFINFSFLFAVRLVIFKKLTYFQAVKSGFRMFKSNLRDSLVTAVINSGFSFFAGIILAIVAAPATLFVLGSGVPGVSHMFVAAWIVILGVFVSIVVNAALAVFIQSNWNQVYFKITKKD